MKKIQVSTVRQTADVEVLFVNANLISKAIRASIAIENIIKLAKAQGCIIPRYHQENDENGNPITDDKGIIKTTPVLDENNKQIIDYQRADITEEDLYALNEQVMPFLTELTEAFEV
jgi:hypothetical protein